MLRIVNAGAVIFAAHWISSWADSVVIDDLLLVQSRASRMDGGRSSPELRQSLTAVVPQYRASAQSFGQLVEKWGYTKDKPIWVTLGDKKYAKFMKQWFDRLQLLGITQSVIVAMDEETELECRKQGLPALNTKGQLVSRFQLLQLLPGDKAYIPQDLTTTKFMLPMIALDMGFESVWFSEMDIYIKEDPYSMVQSTPSMWLNGYNVTDLHSANIIAGGNGRGRRSKLNIGFMKFQGDAAASFIENFLVYWQVRPLDVKTHRVFDQDEFNVKLSETKVEGIPSVGRIPEEYYANTGCDGTDQSLLVHFTFCEPEQKLKLLQLAYDGVSLSSVSEMAKSECNNCSCA